MDIYYTASGNGPYRAKVYRYADDLTRVIIMHHSTETFTSVAKALDAASQWCEDNGYPDSIQDDPEETSF